MSYAKLVWDCNFTLSCGHINMDFEIGEIEFAFHTLNIKFILLILFMIFVVEYQMNHEP